VNYFPGAGFKPGSWILLISASCIARITGMSHWCPAEDLYNIDNLSDLADIYRTCYPKTEENSLFKYT
jgi:hypothetical protein